MLVSGCDPSHGPSRFVKYKVARAQMDSFSLALKLFNSDCGRYPTTAEGLNALVVCPAGTNAMPQWHQYMDRIPLDPWGNAYVYQCPGIHHPDSFNLYSRGADGISKSAGDDYNDINNWDPHSPRDPDRAENLAGLKWSAGLFFLTLATAMAYRRIFKPVGNLHGLIAIGLIFGVAVMAFVAALLGWYWLNSTFVGEGFFLAALAGVIWLAVSGVRRGCLVSKICGWLVIVAVIMLLLDSLFFPRLAG